MIRVRIYYNITRKCWSIRSMSGVRYNRLIGHAVSLQLVNCSFLVSQAGRERVLRERRKNVHAFVDGLLAGQELDPPRWVKEIQRVRYNPYEMEQFAWVKDGQTIESAPCVYCAADGKVYAL